MSLLTQAFALIPDAGSVRGVCAEDLAGLMPVRVSDPARILYVLALRELITVAYIDQSRGKKFYVKAPAATPPADKRPIRCRVANKKKQARKKAALARARRMAKRIAQYSDRPAAASEKNGTRS